MRIKQLTSLTMLIHQAKLESAFLMVTRLRYDPGRSRETHTDVEERRRKTGWKRERESNLEWHLQGSNQTRAPILLSNKIYHSVISHFYSNGSPKDESWTLPPNWGLQQKMTAPNIPCRYNLWTPFSASCQFKKESPCNTLCHLYSAILILHYFMSRNWP